MTDEEEFKKRKEALERKIADLEQERGSLTAEVDSLREKRTILDLEKKAGSLGDSVAVLKREKEDLEGQVAFLEGESTTQGS